MISSHPVAAWLRSPDGCEAGVEAPWGRSDEAPSRSVRSPGIAGILPAGLRWAGWKPALPGFGTAARKPLKAGAGSVTNTHDPPAIADGGLVAEEQAMKQAQPITSMSDKPGASVEKGLTFPDRDFHLDSRAPSAERRAPSAERRAPSAERRAPSAERRAPSAERRAPSAERRAPSAERRAPRP